MRLLLDTHCWLWSVAEPDRLNERARAVLVAPETVGFVSAAAVWELAIKARLGKLRLLGGLHEFLSEAFAGLGFAPLPIQQAHAARTADLPLLHRDPFDRLLVAQAQIEGLKLLTADPLVCRYDVEVLWAGPGSGPARAGGDGVAEPPRPDLGTRRVDAGASRTARASARDGRQRRGR